MPSCSHAPNGWRRAWSQRPKRATSRSPASCAEPGDNRRLFHFIANLKPYLVPPDPGGRRFRGYLVSVDYVAPLRSLVTEVLATGRFLVADNGNVDEIVALIKHFEPRAAPLHKRRKQEEKTLRRHARPGELSAGLTADYRALAEEIVTAARSALDEVRIARVVGVQSAIKPTYLIGPEELTMAVMTGIGVAPEYVSLPLEWYRRSSEQAVALAVRTRHGEFAAEPADVFAGVHGVDFDTARQAGRLAALAGIEGLATGLAGALADRTHVDFRVEDGVVEPAPRLLARPYLRVVDVAAGLHLGYTEWAGRRPRFHALGAGSPILIPLLAVLGDLNTFTAVDSTAPILDAYSSATVALYVDQPAPLKLKAHRIAETWLGGGRAWDCACPFCRGFVAKHPFQLRAARAWWRSEGKRTLEETDLRAPSPLADTLPLLGDSTDPATRREAGTARILHNHWVLRRLESRAQELSGEPERLRDWAAGTIEAYCAHAGDPEWRTAAQVAWSVADRVSRRLEGADPGGDVDPDELLGG